MNDWIQISFDPKKECDMDAYHDTLRDALQEIGERVRLDVQIGGIGAYYVDDKFNYYLVNWTENPWQAKKDMTVQSNGKPLALFEGEWACRGTWFNYVPGALLWYTSSTTKVVVRMQHVLDGDVVLEPISEENPLPQNLKRSTRDQARKLEAMQISDEDHDLLMEMGCQREDFDFEEDVPVDDEGNLVVEEDSEEEESEEEEREEDEESDSDAMEEDNNMEV